MYAAWDALTIYPELVEAEEAADELPQAARINGATPTNVAIPMTRLPRLRPLELARCQES